LPRQRPHRSIWLVGPLAVAIALCLGTTSPAPAQVLRPEVRFPFLADPLQDTPLDPILPDPPVPRPLSPLEQYDLEQDLDQLARQAEALNQAGEIDQARQIWLREVRLRRLLGIDQELAAMDQAGLQLRDRNVTQDLQLFSLRLDEIRAELVLPEDSDRLQAVATTYEILGNVTAAAAIHRSLADAALAAGDRAESLLQLKTLANLQANWFDFEAAAQVYGELETLALDDSDPNEARRYLELQAQNLEQAQDFEGAIARQQQLLLLYQGDPTLWPQIAPLQHQIGNNYLALGDLDTAARQYQAAYTNAIEQQQLEVAATAITDLAEVYKTLGRWADVGYLYEQLLLVEQQAHSAYGMMTAYDQLGQVHDRLGATPAALAAYREGLVLARVLRNRQEYFEAQIARLTKDDS